MRHSIVRMGMAVWLAGCIYQAVCQTDPFAAPPQQAPSDASLYEAIFQGRVLPAGPVLLNGQPANLPGPSLQEAAGLTDAEVKALNGIAADCRASIDGLYRQHPHVIFDALMESIETGKDTSGVAQQLLKDIDNERERIVSDHVQQIRTAFGDARFEALTAWLRADEASRPKKKVVAGTKQ